MRADRVVYIALGCAAAAAVVLLFWARQPDVPAPSAPAAAAGIGQRAADARGAERGEAGPARGAMASGARVDDSAAQGPARHAEGGSTRQLGDPLRRHLPPAIVAAQSGTVRGDDDQIADARTGGGADADGVSNPERPAVAPAGAHRAPAPPGAGSGEHTSEAPPEAAAAPAQQEAPDNPRPAAQVLYDSGDHVFDTASQVELTDAGSINGQAGTLSFWVQPEWQPNNGDAVSFMQLGDSGLQIMKNGSQLRLGLSDGSGLQGGGADIGNWQAGEWRQVTVTWADNALSMYIDGQQQVNGAPVPPQFQENLRLYVGGSAFPDRPAVALAQLAYVTVLNRDASRDEVRQMFESGGPPHP